MSVYHLIVLPRVIQKVQNRGDYDARFKLQEVPCLWWDHWKLMPTRKYY